MFQIEQHLNCIQQNIVEICNYFNVEFYYIFFDSWKFNYNKSYIFSKCLLMPERTEGGLCELTDIEIQQYKDFDKDLLEVISMVQSHAAIKSRYMIMLDSYYCPWHRGYKILHIPHWCLINIYNSKERKFLCEDPFYKIKNCQIHLDDLKMGIESLVVYTMKKKKTNNQNVIGAFKRHLNEVDISVLTSNMSDFANRILNIETINELFDYKPDVYLCNIFRSLKFTADMRYNMSYLFNKFYKLQSDVFYKVISNRFEDCGQKFENINCIIIKLFYSSNKFDKIKHEIYKIMIELIRDENQIYAMLQDYWYK
ncbi:MAG: hypothetical protein HFI75_05785 [Lachnospiraceae bacterium]|nr:hypothetical protein [Lachnospiraceae bacterium]